MEHRIERVSEAIKAELGKMLLREIKDPRIGFVSITAVEVSKDLRFARIFFSVLGEAVQVKATMAGLRSARSYVRREIGRRLRLKFTPEIAFEYDESMARAERIETLLREIHSSEEEPGASA